MGDIVWSSLLPSNFDGSYLSYCWDIHSTLTTTAIGSYDVTVTNLTSGSQVLQAKVDGRVPFIVDPINLALLEYGVDGLLLDFGGFCAFSVVFGE